MTIKQGDPEPRDPPRRADGAPRVRVTAPGGQALESPDGPGPRSPPRSRILRSQQIKATVIGLQTPSPARYTFELMPGSPAITKVTEAAIRRRPASARACTGRGAKRTLVYDVLRRPDQQVTFVEVAAGGKRTIGTVTGGRGTLASPPPRGPAGGTSKRNSSSRHRRRDEDRRRFHAAEPRLGRPAR